MKAEQKHYDAALKGYETPGVYLTSECVSLAVDAALALVEVAEVDTSCAALQNKLADAKEAENIAYVSRNGAQERCNTAERESARLRELCKELQKEDPIKAALDALQTRVADLTSTAEGSVLAKLDAAIARAEKAEKRVAELEETGSPVQAMARERDAAIARAEAAEQLAESRLQEVTRLRGELGDAKFQMGQLVEPGALQSTQWELARLRAGVAKLAEAFKSAAKHDRDDESLTDYHKTWQDAMVEAAEQFRELLLTPTEPSAQAVPRVDGPRFQVTEEEAIEWLKAGHQLTAKGYANTLNAILAKRAAGEAGPVITDRPKSLTELCGPVSVAEAEAALRRFITSHFDGKGEHARISIPADPRRDDDLRLSAFIEQAARRAAGPVVARDELARFLDDLENDESVSYHVEMADRVAAKLGVTLASAPAAEPSRPAVGAVVSWNVAREDMGAHPEARYHADDEAADCVHACAGGVLVTSFDGSDFGESCRSPCLNERAQWTRLPDADAPAQPEAEGLEKRVARLERQISVHNDFVRRLARESFPADVLEAAAEEAAAYLDLAAKGGV